MILLWQEAEDLSLSRPQLLSEYLHEKEAAGKPVQRYHSDLVDVAELLRCGWPADAARHEMLA